MNPRIHELTEQAYRLTVLASHSEPHKCVIGSDYFNALEKEKFAELIVRECAKIAKKEQEFNNRYSQDMVNIDQCILIEFGL